MPIRNFAVARGDLVDTAFHTIYTVPVGNSLILKSVLSSQQSGQAASLSITVHDPVTGANILAAIVPSSATQLGTWSGWFVLNAGDTIIAQASVAHVYYWLSGAVLPFAAS